MGSRDAIEHRPASYFEHEGRLICDEGPSVGGGRYLREVNLESEREMARGYIAGWKGSLN